MDFAYSTNGLAYGVRTFDSALDEKTLAGYGRLHLR
jgi:hypothetical protein